MPAFSFDPTSRATRTEQYLAYLRAMSNLEKEEQAQKALTDWYQQRLEQAQSLLQSDDSQARQLGDAMKRAQAAVIGELNDKVWESATALGRHSTIWTENAAALDWVYAFNLDQEHCKRFKVRDMQLLYRISTAEEYLAKRIEQAMQHYSKGLSDYDLYDLALKRMEEVLEKRPNEYTLWHRVGLIYLYVPNLFNPEKAKEALCKAADLAEKEEDTLALPLLRVFYGEELSFQDAVRAAASDAYFHSAVVSYVLGDYNAMSQMALRAYQLSPKFLEAGFLSAKGYALTKKDSDAIDLLRRVLEVEPFYAIKTAADYDLIMRPAILDYLHQLLTEADAKTRELLKKCREMMVSDSEAAPILDELEKRAEMKNYFNLRDIQNEVRRERRWRLLPTSFRLQKNLSGHALRINAMVFSPNGRQLASASWKTIITDTRTGEQLQTLMEESARNYVYALAYSPDGKILATAGSTHVIRLWNAETGQEIKKLEGHSRAVHTVAFSPDGKLLASGSADKTVKIWDVAKGKEVKTLKGHTDTVNKVVFSPDGKQLASASADKTIKLWSVKTAAKPKTLTGHTHSVTSIEYSPSGEMLASGSWDKTIRLWEIPSGKELRVLQGHESGIESVQFARDGRSLTSTSYNRISKQCQIKLWDVHTGAQIDQSEGRFYAVTLSADGNGLAVATGEKTIKLSTAPMLSLESFVELERRYKEGATNLDRRKGPRREREERRKVNIPVAVERRKANRTPGAKGPDRRTTSDDLDIPFL
ncbi:MAG: WD40 repeat domain-containing protein [Chloroherpetonaceae bacterium]|nr:WD40 repeat domain-containing protein [Chloroherpetonaceae bacterium]